MYPGRSCSHIPWKLKDTELSCWISILYLLHWIGYDCPLLWTILARSFRSQSLKAYGRALRYLRWAKTHFIKYSRPTHPRHRRSRNILIIPEIEFYPLPCLVSTITLHSNSDNTCLDISSPNSFHNDSPDDIGVAKQILKGITLKRGHFHTVKVQ